MECQFCDHRIRERRDYYTLDVCLRCHIQLQLNKLKGKSAPVDPYLISQVDEEDAKYVNALAHYATLFPKAMAPDLLGMCITSLDDEEMSDVFIISMIMAARTICMFGTEEEWDGNMKSGMIHALHVLGNLVGISVIGCGLERNGHDPDEEDMREFLIGVDERLEEVIREMRVNDGGTLGRYLDVLMPEIMG